MNHEYWQILSQFDIYVSLWGTQLLDKIYLILLLASALKKI
jgi:hypothetical protein